MDFARISRWHGFCFWVFVCEIFLNILCNSLSGQSFFVLATMRTARKKILADCRGNFRVQIFLKNILKGVPEGRLLSKGDDHAFAACGSARQVQAEFKNQQRRKTQ